MRLSARPPEDLPHDLVGPAADRTEASVPYGSLELDVRADQSQALVLQLEVGPLGGELGHRDLADGVAAGQEPAQRVVGHRLAGGRSRGELGDAMPDGLAAATELAGDALE